MKNTIFTGAATAIVTPLNKNGVDYESLGRLIEWQIENGIDAIVSVGTTGEGSTLTDKEHKEVISERRKAWRTNLKEENPELLKAIDKKHNDSEKRSKRDKAYYLKHKDEISARAKANPKTAMYKRRYKLKQRLKKTGPVISSLLLGIINSKEK
jgi:hypothetical protein